jgi:hypothetical protein
MVFTSFGVGQDGDFTAILPEPLDIAEFVRVPVDHDQIDVVGTGQELENRKIPDG